jgi:hypothetical protein
VALAWPHQWHSGEPARIDLRFLWYSGSLYPAISLLLSVERVGVSVFPGVLDPRLDGVAVVAKQDAFLDFSIDCLD